MSDATWSLACRNANMVFLSDFSVLGFLVSSSELVKSQVHGYKILVYPQSRLEGLPSPSDGTVWTRGWMWALTPFPIPLRYGDSY